MMYTSQETPKILPQNFKNETLGSAELGVQNFETEPLTALNKLHIPELEDLAKKYCLCDPVLSKPLFENLPLTNGRSMTRIDNIGYNSSPTGINSGLGMNNFSNYNIRPEEISPHMSFQDRENMIGYDRYKCDYKGCESAMLSPSNILHHTHMHSGVKPYICQWCGKRFTQKGNLKKHVRQHIHPDVNDRKRYSCKICGKGYTERYNLRAHIKKHHSEK